MKIMKIPNTKLQANDKFQVSNSKQTRLPLQARPPAKQGEAAWGTSGQVSMTEIQNSKQLIDGFISKLNFLNNFKYLWL